VEALREELAEIISFELEDPRVEGVNVVDVVVDPGLRRAQVQVVSRSGSAEEAVAALENARGYLKGQLAERLDMRRVPDLHFGVSADLGPPERVESILRRIKRGRPRK
jgi:ribosome-binding factor A